MCPISHTFTYNL